MQDTPRRKENMLYISSTWADGGIASRHNPTSRQLIRRACKMRDLVHNFFVSSTTCREQASCPLGPCEEDLPTQNSFHSKFMQAALQLVSTLLVHLLGLQITRQTLSTCARARIVTQWTCAMHSRFLRHMLRSHLLKCQATQPHCHATAPALLESKHKCTVLFVATCCLAWATTTFHEIYASRKDFDYLITWFASWPNVGTNCWLVLCVNLEPYCGDSQPMVQVAGGSRLRADVASWCLNSRQLNIQLPPFGKSLYLLCLFIKSPFAKDPLKCNMKNTRSAVEGNDEAT